MNQLAAAQYQRAATGEITMRVGPLDKTDAGDPTFDIEQWLAATPLVILLALVAAGVMIAIASKIIEGLAGTQASENFVANTMTLFGMLVLVTPLAIAIYALVSLARWLIARRR